MEKTIHLFNSLRANIVGAAASTLCLIHCLITPFVFMAEASMDHHHHADSPIWWGMIDILFLIISFIAIYRSNQTISKRWIGIALWLNWFALLLFILNEKIEITHLPEFLIFIPALALVGLHLYGQKYCQCEEDCIH